MFIMFGSIILKHEILTRVSTEAWRILVEKAAGPQVESLAVEDQPSKDHTLGGTTYLSNTTCLIRPHLFYACFVVSRMTIICYITHQF